MLSSPNSTRSARFWAGLPAQLCRRRFPDNVGRLTQRQESRCGAVPLMAGDSVNEWRRCATAADYHTVSLWRQLQRPVTKWPAVAAAPPLPPPLTRHPSPRGAARRHWRRGRDIDDALVAVSVAVPETMPIAEWWCDNGDADCSQTGASLLKHGLGGKPVCRCNCKRPIYMTDTLIRTGLGI